MPPSFLLFVSYDGDTFVRHNSSDNVFRLFPSSWLRSAGSTTAVAFFFFFFSGGDSAPQTGGPGLDSPVLGPGAGDLCSCFSGPRVSRKPGEWTRRDTLVSIDSRNADRFERHSSSLTDAFIFPSRIDNGSIQVVGDRRGAQQGTAAGEKSPHHHAPSTKKLCVCRRRCT